MTKEELLKPRYRVCPKAIKYEVSDNGSVRSLKTGRILKAANNNRGYLYVELQVSGKQERFYIHRLVAELFVDNEYGLPVVHHKDGVKTNNHYTNLEWASYQYNSRHAFNTGLGKSGFEHYSSRFSQEDFWEIKLLHEKGVKNFEIARLYNVSETAVRNLVLGNSYKHVVVPRFDLLTPRFRVKINYPFSVFKVGEIITTGKNSYLYRTLKEFPEIFIPIEWWEDREEKDMPEYVKVKRASLVPKKDIPFFAKVTDRIHTLPVLTGFKLSDGTDGLYANWANLEPATKEEYEKQKS